MNQTQVLDKRPSLNLADLLHPSTLGRSNSLFPTCPTPAALIPRFDSAKLDAALAPVLGQALKEPRLPAIRHRRLTEPPNWSCLSQARVRKQLSTRFPRRTAPCRILMAQPRSRRTKR